MAMNIDSASKMARTRSPTSWMIASNSSCCESASPISLMRASSALRWRVSSMARARVKAVAMWLPTKVRISRSSACSDEPAS